MKLFLELDTFKVYGVWVKSYGALYPDEHSASEPVSMDKARKKTGNILLINDQMNNVQTTMKSIMWHNV